MTAPVLDQSGSSDQEGVAVAWPVPERETDRVRALHDYGVLDQPPQSDLDAAVRLAAYVCGTSTASINLIDSDRQWQAAVHGGEPGETSRETSLCAHTVMGTDVVHTPDAARDPRFAGSPAVQGPNASIHTYAAAPLLTRDGLAIGTVCASDPSSWDISDRQLGLLRDVAGQVMAHFELRRTTANLARSAARDPLTGLANRRWAEQAITAAIGRAERGLGMPSVVVVDLDDFKEINDRHGYPAGDALLRHVADRLVRTARTVDTVGRLGGDEFVVLLEHTGGPGATAALSRFRHALEEGWEHIEGATAGVPASLGITTYRPGDRTASMIARADAEMYAEKAGRDRSAR